MRNPAGLGRGLLLPLVAARVAVFKSQGQIIPGGADSQALRIARGHEWRRETHISGFTRPTLWAVSGA